MDRQQQQLAAASDVLGRLRMVVLALTRSPHAPDIPDLIVSQAVAAAGGYGGVLGVVRGDRIEIIGHRGYPPEVRARFDPLVIGPHLPLTDAVLTREAIWLPSGEDAGIRYPQMSSNGTPRATVSLPLMIGEEPIGVLGVSFDDLHVSDRIERLFLLSLADICALALRDWETGRDGSERAQLLTLLQTLVREAPLGFAFFDRDIRYQMVNEALAEINGVQVEDHIGRHLTEVVPDVGARAVPLLRQVLETGEPVRGVEISGETPAQPGVLRTWVQNYYRVQADSCDVLGVGALVSEVTEQRRGERRLRQLIDALYSFVGLCTPDGVLVEANRAALHMGGLAPEEVLGRPLWQTYWWSWDATVSEQLRASFERGRRGEASRYDVDIRIADDQFATIDFQLVPVVEAGRVVALVPSGIDITERRRSVEWTSALAHLGRQLNASMVTRDVELCVTELVAPALGAAYTAVGLVDRSPGGTVRLVRSRHAPPELTNGCRSAPLDASLDLCEAIRTRRMVIRGDEASGAARPLADDAVGAGLVCAATTPLSSGSGDPVGALTVAWTRPVQFTEELLARLQTVAEMCAQGIDRARLAEARTADARRAQQLSALSQQLASATTTSEVCAVLADQMPGVTGVASAAIVLLVHETGELVLQHDPLRGGRYGPRPRGPYTLADPVPVADAARTGHPVYVASPDEMRRRYPRVAADFAAAGLHAAAALPLRTSSDEVIGALGVVWDAPVTFDSTILATLATAAELCGQTLERAQLYEAEHALVEGLQRRLLRDMPAVPGLDTHAIYRPADPTIGMGGDFYGGLSLDDWRLALIVGDITGHGVTAAADMAELRTLLSALLSTGTPLVEIFDRAESALHLTDSTLAFATAVVAICDTSDDTVEYLHAGHPPLLLRRPDGEVVIVDDGRRPLIGLPVGGTRTGRVPFPPGTVLVAYTDGLVERRDEAVDLGIGRLVDALATASGDAEQIARTLLDRCRSGAGDFDDVAVVVIRREAA
ncbi:MAG TPA: SpoIIE family protein phosphatase [Micromonosporaceae bacterium]